MSDSTLIAGIQSEFIKSDVPVIETGMEVEVHQIIKEWEKERIQVFRGLVIGTQGSTALSHTMTVRADYDGVGIEKVFPLHSPYVEKIVVLRKFYVRHKHIGFIRWLRWKAARLKEIKPTRSVEEKKEIKKSVSAKRKVKAAEIAEA